MFSVFYFPLLGTPTAPNNELTFYEAGTDVPLVVYTDSDGIIPWSQPIVFNAAGEPDGVIYVDPDGPSLKVVYEDENGVAIPGYPVDNIPPGEILNVLTTAITTLTDAQIKALPTTGMTVVAAPSAGVRLKVLGVSYSANTSAGAYTNIDASYADLHLAYGAGGTDWATYGPVDNAITTPVLTNVTALLGGAAQRVYDPGVPLLVTPSGWTSPDVLNNVTGTYSDESAKALVLEMNNAAGDLTGGNAANTLTVTVYYALEVL